MNISERELARLSKETAPLTLVTESCEQTEAFGAALARCYLQSDCTLPPYIALRGDLGVGKTAFVRGFAGVLAPKSAVRSPTFALVNEYRSPIKGCSVFHFDMYRITDEDDLYSIGYDDYLERGICVVEWSENIPYAIPDEHLTLIIEKIDPSTPDCRKLTLDINY